MYSRLRKSTPDFCHFRRRIATRTAPSAASATEAARWRWWGSKRLRNRDYGVAGRNSYRPFLSMLVQSQDRGLRRHNISWPQNLGETGRNSDLLLTFYRTCDDAQHARRVHARWHASFAGDHQCHLIQFCAKKVLCNRHITFPGSCESRAIPSGERRWFRDMPF